LIFHCFGDIQRFGDLVKQIADSLFVIASVKANKIPKTLDPYRMFHWHSSEVQIWENQCVLQVICLDVERVSLYWQNRASHPKQVRKKSRAVRSRTDNNSIARDLPLAHNLNSSRITILQKHLGYL
jgi:hypothetical protein